MEKLRRNRELLYFHNRAKTTKWLMQYYNTSQQNISRWKIDLGINRPIKIDLDINGVPTQKFMLDNFLYVYGTLYAKFSSGGGVSVGGTIGCKRKDGYYQVGMYGKVYRLHNLIWIYHNGSIEKGLTVDHIKGLYNSIENLRLATKGEQNRNISTNIKEQSKILGVRYSNNKWSVNIDRKYFGIYTTKQEAEYIAIKNKDYKKSKEKPTITDLCLLFEHPDNGDLIRLLTKGNQVAGSTAGSINSYGYMVTTVNNYKIYNHIIIYTLYHDMWPKNEIHHIDFNKLNNKIDNLIDLPTNIHRKVHQEYKNTGNILNREDIQVLL